VIEGDIEIFICKAISFKKFSINKTKFQIKQKFCFSYETIVVVKKENDQCTKEIHIENYKDEQILINHLFK